VISIFFFFFFYSSPNLSGCLPYFDTWCGPSANLECRSERRCTRLAANVGPKKSPKIAIWAPSHNFLVFYVGGSISMQYLLDVLCHVIASCILKTLVEQRVPNYGSVHYTVSSFLSPLSPQMDISQEFMMHDGCDARPLFPATQHCHSILAGTHFLSH